MSVMKKAALAVALALGVGVVHADVEAPWAFERFMRSSTGAGQQTFGYGSNGTPLASSTATLGTNGGAGARATFTGQMKNAAGNLITMTGRAGVSNQAMASAIGRAMSRVAWPLAAGYAVYDLATELGYGLKHDGEKTVAEKTQTVCLETGGCHWRTNTHYDTRGATSQDACQNYVAFFYPGKYGISTPDPVNSSKAFCRAYWSTDNAYFNGWSQNRYGSPTQQTYDATQEFIDEIATQSGWPSSSAIAAAAAEATKALGETLPLEEPKTLEGPATSPGRVTETTTTNPDGSIRKEKVTCTFHHTYSGMTMNTVEKCVTTVENDGEAGVNTTKGETTTTPGGNMSETTPEENAVCGIDGKPACNVKVDEKGTPEALKLEPQQEADKAFQELKDFAQDPTAKLPAFPTLNWAFELPTGCLAISLPAFAPYLEAIDVCQFQPLFHELMSIIWVLGGLFGAISMFWRSALSAN